MELLLFLVKLDRTGTVLARGLLWDEARKRQDIPDVAVCAVTIGAEDAADSVLWGGQQGAVSWQGAGGGLLRVLTAS